MNFIDSLFNPLQNCEYVISKVCKFLEIPVTTESIVKHTIEHPDYPSMLTVSDVLSGFGVESASARLELGEDLIKLTLPFIVQIVKPGNNSKLFSIIYKIDGNIIEWEDPVKCRREKIELEEFRKYFTGYVQIFEKNEHSGENDYLLKKNRERKNNLVNSLMLFTIPGITIASALITLINYGLIAVYPVIYSLLLLTGSIISGLLVLYEVGEYNPTLNKVCTGGARTNCSAILQSGGSKIFGISWSVIGFSYFLGLLLALLSRGLVDTQVLKAAWWLNIATLPYVFYSVYYQARVAKQWCPLCLAVQVVLLTLFLTSFSSTVISEGHATTQAFVSIFINILVLAIASILLMKAVKGAKSAKNLRYSLQSLKHNPEVFGTLLRHSREIAHSVDGLGIILGNPAGKIHLIKVCNPYCGPCANAHPVIENVIKNNPEIKLQIIYTSVESDWDRRNKPVKAFLSLDKSDNKELVSNALDKWYNGIEYNQFEKLYPIDQETLDAQLPSIKKMREWCEKTEIEYTPTFFVNGHQLPKIYSFQDLKYLFSV